MTRNLKPLGLAFLAALAIAAAAAPAASAESFIFRSDAEEETTLTGEQDGEDVFTTTAGTVKCGNITYTGSQSGDEAATVEVAPAYSSCTAFGFAGTEVNANGCKYRLEPETVESEKFEGSMDIVCPAGKQITATAKLFGVTKCTVHIPPQTGLEDVTYTNVGSEPGEVTVDLDLSGIKYTHTAGTGLGACTSGSAENGTYQGAALVTGESESESVGLAADRIGTWLTVTPNTLNFSKLKAGQTTPFKLYNGHAIKRYIKGMSIVNNLEEVEEAHFRLHSDDCEGVLNAGEECTVNVEFVSGTLKKVAWLRVFYGGWWFFTATHLRKGDIVS